MVGALMGVSVTLSLMRYSYACEDKVSDAPHRKPDKPEFKLRQGLFVLFFGNEGHDEPESLILAQSERWRHA